MPKIKNMYTGEMKDFGYDIMGEQEAQTFIDTGVWERVEDNEQSIFATEDTKKEENESVMDTFKGTGFKSEFNKDFGLKALKKLSGFDKLAIKPLGFQQDDEEDDDFGW